MEDVEERICVRSAASAERRRGGSSKRDTNNSNASFKALSSSESSGAASTAGFGGVFDVAAGDMRVDDVANVHFFAATLYTLADGPRSKQSNN